MVPTTSPCISLHPTTSPYIHLHPPTSHYIPLHPTTSAYIPLHPTTSDSLLGYTVANLISNLRKTRLILMQTSAKTCKLTQLQPTLLIGPPSPPPPHDTDSIGNDFKLFSTLDSMA